MHFLFSREGERASERASGNKTAKSRRFRGARYKWKSVGSVRVASGADPFFFSLVPLPFPSGIIISLRPSHACHHARAHIYSRTHRFRITCASTCGPPRNTSRRSDGEEKERDGVIPLHDDSTPLFPLDAYARSYASGLYTVSRNAPFVTR